MNIAKVKNYYPNLFLLIVVFMSTIQYGIIGQAVVMPMIDIMAVYYWGIYRHNLLGYIFLFIIGIIYDAIIGWNLGMHSLIYVLLKFYLTSKYDSPVKESFKTVWINFAVYSAVIVILYWMIFSIINKQILDLNAALVQYLLTVITYPILHVIMNYINLTISEKQLAK